MAAKIKRVEREEDEYPDRDVHVTFLVKQLKAGEWLMASGICDQITTLQRKATEHKARLAARKRIKREKMEVCVYACVCVCVA